MDETAQSWHVYLLTCADGTLYCGATNDLARRLTEHNAGTGAKYTRSRLPVTLTASAAFADRSEAQRVEAAVKKRPRDRKQDYLLSLAAQGTASPAPQAEPQMAGSATAPEEQAPKAKPSRSAKAKAAKPEAQTEPQLAGSATTPEEQAPKAKPSRSAKPKAAKPEAQTEPQLAESAPAPEEQAPKAKPSRSAKAKATKPEAKAEPQLAGSAPAPEEQAPKAKPSRSAKAKATKPEAKAEPQLAESAPAPEEQAPKAKPSRSAKAKATKPEAKAEPQLAESVPAPKAQAPRAPKARPKAPKNDDAPCRQEVVAPDPGPCTPLNLLDRRLIPRRELADIEPYRGKITKEDINILPLGAWCGEIVIVDTEQAALKAAAAMREEKVLGFDTESRPAFKKGRYYLPSIIQVATTETVYIYMLGRLAFPESLQAVFEDPNIIKTGVAVRDDVKDLQKVSHFDPRGFIDLGVVALHLKLDTHGLRNLAAKFLGIRISKAARCTNWANPRLTPAQINYAATDAWISRELFLAMDREGLIAPERDYGNGNGARIPDKDSKTRARVRRGSRSRRS